MTKVTAILCTVNILWLYVVEIVSNQAEFPTASDKCTGPGNEAKTVLGAFCK